MSSESAEKARQTAKANVAALRSRIRRSNPYFAGGADMENARTVVRLYAGHPKHYVKMMASEKHRDRYRRLVEWIYGKTAFLKDDDSFRYDLQTRLNWIFNGKGPGTKCKAGCGRTPALRRKLRLNDPFPEYCSAKCSAGAGETIEKARATRYAANGGRWESDETRWRIAGTIRAKLAEDPEWFRKRTAKCEATKIRNGHGPKWNNRAKMRRTVAAHVKDDPGYYEKIAEKSKATKSARHGNPNWVNPGKARETNMARRGVDNPNKDPAVKAKSKETFRRNHPGMTSSFQLPGVMEKAVASFRARYGVDNPMLAEEVRDKCRDTVFSEYGVDHVWKLQSVREKADRTKMAKYGTLAFRRRYLVDGESFDSSWEAYLWAYCVDSGKTVKRNPRALKYAHGGREYVYIPDFEVDGGLVEIKGDQFFRPDGTMFCPYRYPEWTDEQYEDVCRRYEAKRRCMLANGVRIMRRADMEAIIAEVDARRGRGWLNEYKVMNGAAV